MSANSSDHDNQLPDVAMLAAHLDDLNLKASSSVVQDRSRKIQTQPGVFIKTYGCQMNEYDSKKLLKILEDKYQEVDSASDASLVIINTCSVRDKAEQKLYSILGQLQDLKKGNPDLMIGVGGCVAQQEGQQVVKRSKIVDFVFGTHNLSLVPSLISARKQGYSAQVAVDYRDEWEDLPLGIGGESKVTAFIAISRGCNKNCSYCIVPTTRGPEVSRPIDELLREIRLLAHRGCREVVLLGQTVNSYGLDFNPRISFVDLLSKVAEIKGIERIRFMSPHPQEIRQDLIDFLGSNPKICAHIHLPLQSGSNRILKLMNRNYRREKYLQIVESLKARVPDVSITTDLIIGFPGETESDFEDSLELLELAKFDSSFSFLFSPRPGTLATKMLASEQGLNPVPEEIAKERLLRWQTRQNEITTERLSAWVGKTCEVLIEGASNHHPDLLKGRSSQNFVVNLQSSVPQLKVGMFAEVKLTGVGRYTLKGEVLRFQEGPFAEYSRMSSEHSRLLANQNGAMQQGAMQQGAMQQQGSIRIAEADFGTELSRSATGSAIGIESVSHVEKTWPLYE